MTKEEIKKIIKEIQELYKEGYGLKTEREIFYHLLEQVGRHISKISKLRGISEEDERFKREIADLYLLSLGLVELEGIDEEIIETAANYYLNKVKTKSKK